MSLRSIASIEHSTLQHLVSLCFSDAEIEALLAELPARDVGLAALVAQLVSRAQLESDLAHHLECRLDALLGALCPQPQAINCVSTPLREAAADNDGLLVAAILWRAARQPGLAWRRFETRAHMTLMVIALGRFSILQDTVVFREQAVSASSGRLQAHRASDTPHLRVVR